MDLSQIVVQRFHVATRCLERGQAVSEGSLQRGDVPAVREEARAKLWQRTCGEDPRPTSDQTGSMEDPRQTETAAWRSTSEPLTCLRRSPRPSG